MWTQGTYNLRMMSQLSDDTDFTSGVIQGKFLRPQLYSVFTFSNAACIHDAHHLLCADDLKLLVPITSNASQAALQAELHR